METLVGRPSNFLRWQFPSTFISTMSGGMPTVAHAERFAGVGQTADDDL
jgi:hypothetical protein